MANPSPVPPKLRPGGVRLLEALEDALAGLLLDADAGVMHLEAQPAEGPAVAARSGSGRP